MPASCVRLLAGFVLVGLGVVAFAQTCERDWKNTDDPSPFVCEMRVELVRTDACEVIVTETILFPSTTDIDLFRSVQRLNGYQRVRDISLLRDGNPIEIRSVQRETNELKVPFPAEKNEQPVTYILRYVLVNGNLQFTRTCPNMDDNVQPDSNDNILRWRRGTMREDIEKLTVTFSSDLDKGKLSVIGNLNGVTRESDRNLTIEQTKVDSNIELYVREEGVEPCARDLRCFEPGKSRYWVPVIIVLSVLIFVVVILTMFAWYRTRAKQKRRSMDMELPSL